jgi:capsular polysaccharide biosynthesis protein
VLADISAELFPNVAELWRRIGFKTVVESSPNRKYSAEVLVMVESAPKVHPHYFEKLRELIDLPKRNRTKIVWIVRKKENSYYAQRLMANQGDVIEALAVRFGRERLVVFDHHKYGLNETIELFASAKAIIGAHGGGMYNQFFASKMCTIVEIMPVRPNGLYPDQVMAGDVPSFSHMAVWSNSLLIGQEFWRYYAMASGNEFRLNITSFMRFLAQIPRLH